MSNLQAVIKVADQILARIFDQRQFTSGEINYLNREIGERAKLDENFDRILKIDQNVCMISDLESNELCKTGDAAAKEVINEVTNLQERLEKLLRKEEIHQREEEELLRQMREERYQAQQKERLVNVEKLQQIKDALALEELELKKKLAILENNLRNN